MKNNVKIEHPYSIKEFIIEEKNQKKSEMFLISLPKSNANIDWVEAIWRKDLNRLEKAEIFIEMFYSKQSYLLEENGSPNIMFPFEDIEKSEYHEFDTIILISRENVSSLGKRVVEMLANEILLNYVLNFKKR
jgi:hypothetical protein